MMRMRSMWVVRMVRVWPMWMVRVVRVRLVVVRPVRVQREVDVWNVDVNEDERPLRFGEPPLLVQQPLELLRGSDFHVSSCSSFCSLVASGLQG